MSFVSNVLNGVNGIQYFYIVGIFIFIGLFIVMIYRTIKIPKKDLTKIKSSILDDDNIEPNEIK